MAWTDSWPGDRPSGPMDAEHSVDFYRAEERRLRREDAWRAANHIPKEAVRNCTWCGFQFQYPEWVEPLESHFFLCDPCKDIQDLYGCIAFRHVARYSEKYWVLCMPYIWKMAPPYKLKGME